MTWHLLQISDVLDIEFGTALAERVPLLSWEPIRTLMPGVNPGMLSAVREITDPPLEIQRFPLMRGYARFPWSVLARTGAAVSARLLRKTADPANSPLICTIPYFAAVAERWPGPVIYWLTDLIESYGGADSTTVRRLDQRMCRAATLVCPNSQRLAQYLMDHAQCPEIKIRVLPNATRASNLLPSPPHGPAQLPEDIADLKRPIAGIIGNLAGNMDWVLLEELVGRCAGVNWAFIGPTSMAITDRVHSRAREHVMQLPNVRFAGPKPYGELAGYARAFDAAVLPYLRSEPTYSGSSTRFYEHLAACRPMVATAGLEELTRKVPLLRLIETAEQAAEAIADLEALGFDDGLTTARWEESQNGTWQARAAQMQEELSAMWRPLAGARTSDPGHVGGISKQPSASGPAFSGSPQKR